jgi:glycosyltransferase involved in cell wall biosynthesis
MRALLLSPELFLAEGGIARIMRLYLKALCDIAGPGGRVDSIVLNDQPGRDERLARYASLQLGEHVGCGRRKRHFIAETIRLGRHADLLVCGHLHHLAIARLAKVFNPRLRYYLVAHGIEVWRPYTWLEKSALLGAHRILCVSEYTRRQMLRFHPALRPERLVVVHNTLDPYFAAKEQVVPTATPFAQPRILTVSRLLATDTYKGVDTMIETMQLVRREYPLARLRIVGTGDDQPRLLALAQRLGIGGAVDFLGSLDDHALRCEYAACDLFALPSRKEGFGLVFLEAMTYGKPCLGARAGGVPEVINDTVGQLAEYGNIPDLAAAVSDLIRHPRDSEVVRRHVDTFAFPAFTRRLAAVLS